MFVDGFSGEVLEESMILKEFMKWCGGAKAKAGVKVRENVSLRFIRALGQGVSPRNGQGQRQRIPGSMLEL